MVHAGNCVRNCRQVVGDVSASVLTLRRENGGSRPVEAFPARLVVSHSLAALCGLVSIPAGLVPNLLHSSVNFAKEVLVGLTLHD